MSVKEPAFIRGNNVAWTADGTQLLFVKGSSNEQKNEVWRISVRGGEPQKTGLSMNGLRNIQVHPDGRRIAFVAGDSKAEVWVMEDFLQAAQSQKTSVSRR